MEQRTLKNTFARFAIRALGLAIAIAGYTYFAKVNDTEKDIDPNQNEHHEEGHGILPDSPIYIPASLTTGNLPTRSR